MLSKPGSIEYKESKSISTSLDSFRPCIQKIKNGEALRRLEWRGSELTKVLSKFFTPETSIQMIATVNPRSDIDNLLGSLAFASAFPVKTLSESVSEKNEREKNDREKVLTGNK